jgi:hypothetical protein
MQYSAMRQTDLMLNPGKFYKGEGQEKNLTFGRRFSCFPARMIEQDLFQPFAPGARFAAHCCVAVLVFTPSGFHCFSQRRQSVLKLNKQSGDQVAHHGSI